VKNIQYKSVTVNDASIFSQLLFERQEDETEVFPFLKNEYLTLGNIEQLMNDFLSSTNIIGLCAFIDDVIVGYIVGEIRVDAYRGNGRHIWVPYHGIAICREQSPELLRELYSEVSKLWIKAGCFNHIINIPLGDHLYLEALQRLSFAIDHVHGVMPLTDFSSFQTSCQTKVRFAGKGDEEKLGSLSRVILSSLNQSPTYLPVIRETVDGINKGFKDLVNDDESIVFLAEENDKAVAFQVYEYLDNGIMIPDNSIELSVAGTLKAFAGQGLGKHLTDHTCEVMKEKGFDFIISDWKMSNLSASTFWPKCGFKPISFRMTRMINKDVTWASIDKY